MMSKAWRVLVVLALVLSALLSFSGLALAQGCEITGEGLNGPMGVLVDPDGNVWVTDSGVGGAQRIQALNPEAGSLVPATVGTSARLLRINAADGSMDEVAFLRSVAMEGGASGGNRIAILDGTIYVSVSDWLSTPDRPAPKGIGDIVSVDPETRKTTQVFNGWEFESTQNPYGVVMHAHPFGLLAGSDGLLWVADAGANAVYTVDPATGEATVKAVLEPLPGVFPRPDYDNQMLTDPVPTSLALKDGGLYVSLLSGVPFVPGSAKVQAIAEDGALTDYATGLTMLTDMRTGPDGNLYATTFAVFGEQGPIPGSGAVVRIGEGDTSEVVVSGLNFATSLDFDADGNLYVATNGMGAPGSGTVEMCAAVTAAEGTSLADWLTAVMAPPPPAEEAATEEAPAEEAPVAETAPMTETVAVTETVVAEATPEPTAEPTAEPMAEPTAEPVAEAAATEAPMAEPTAAPTEEPMAEPTAAPAEEAPEALPATGGSNNSIWIVVASVLVLAAVTAFSVLKRRTA